MSTALRAAIGRMSLAIAIGALLAAGAQPTAAAAPKPVSVAYYMGSDIYGRGYFPKHIPVGAFSHIDYAFGKPTANGRCAVTDAETDYTIRIAAANSADGQGDTADQRLRGTFNQLKELKAAHPGLKVLISIGGWTLSRYFSDVAATDVTRRAFVRSCIDLFIRGDLPRKGTAGGPGAARGVFDGIDIDWEFPVAGGAPGNHHRPADRRNATLLFKEFRRQLDTYGETVGRRFLLTAAVPAGNASNQAFELARLGGVLDWLGVMTYDMHGGWDATTSFNSPFRHDPTDPVGSKPNTVVGTVAYLRAKGVPANRIVVGIPFYGLQHVQVNEGPGEVADGLYAPFDDAGLDGSGDWSTATNPTYHELVDVAGIVTIGDAPTGLNGFSRHVRSEARQPWLWNPTSQGGRFISYDDPASVRERVALVERLGLRGLMAWEVSQDNDAQDLAWTMAEVLP